MNQSKLFLGIFFAVTLSCSFLVASIEEDTVENKNKFCTEQLLQDLKIQRAELLEQNEEADPKQAAMIEEKIRRIEEGISRLESIEQSRAALYRVNKLEKKTKIALIIGAGLTVLAIVGAWRLYKWISGISDKNKELNDDLEKEKEKYKKSAKEIKRILGTKISILETDLRAEKLKSGTENAGLRKEIEDLKALQKQFEKDIEDEKKKVDDEKKKGEEKDEKLKKYDDFVKASTGREKKFKKFEKKQPKEVKEDASKEGGGTEEEEEEE
jgi:hypothetical protein